MKYYPPEYNKNEFHCPRCGVYAAQRWLDVYSSPIPGSNNIVKNELFDIVECTHCQQESYWYKSHLIDPSETPIPQPHEDLPESCKLDYKEARDVFVHSPRASAALLRLCVQKLLSHIGGKGKNIDSDIKELVNQGLPTLVQQALDYCRVVGNNSVHPGEININDSPDIASSMFEMINFIVQDRITKPKEIQALYDRLPENAKKAIQKRDSNIETV